MCLDVASLNFGNSGSKILRVVIDKKHQVPVPTLNIYFGNESKYL